MQTGFVDSTDGVRIQYASSLEWDASLPPLLFVPGMLGILDFYEQEIRDFSPRRVIAFSHRGLGKSELPNNVRTAFRDRCRDIHAVTSGLEISKYFLCGFLSGVSLSIEHALNYPKEVKGLILIDCDAQYKRPSQAWLDDLRTNRDPQLPLDTIIRYFEDAQDVDLTDRLKELSQPVLIFRGGQKGTFLPEDKAKQMQTQLQNGSQLIVLPNSAHDIVEEDFPLFKNATQAFIGEH